MRFKNTIQLDSGLLIPAGAGAGKVLTSDASGNATWATPGAGAPSGPAGGVLSGTYPAPGFAVDMATQAELDTHAGGTGNGAHIPTGGIADAHVAAGAAIGESKLALASDAAAGVASRRTLGTGALQAAPGNHTHAISSLTGAITEAQTPLTTKGDLLITDGTTLQRVVVGANGQVLTADSAQVTGVKWAPAAAPVIPLVSVLPASPTDGQMVRYQSAAMATDGVEWLLAYRAASSSPYKWEYVGGPRLFAEVATSQATASGATVYTDLTTVGPSVTLPLAGDYEMDFGASMWNNTAGQYCATTVKLGAAAASDNESVAASSHVAGQETSPVRTIARTGLAAGASLKLMYRVTAGVGTFQRRWIAVRPRRVG